MSPTSLNMLPLEEYYLVDLPKMQYSCFNSVLARRTPYFGVGFHDIGFHI